MATATFRVWRGDAQGGKFQDFVTEVAPGMVVLDAIHEIQARQANDLAVRWNCKAGKCGSCSAEINGMPKLMCMTRLSQLPLEKPVTVEPMRSFPLIKDLVTDVSWNFRVKEQIKPFRPRKPDAPDGTWRMDQKDVDVSRNSANVLSAFCARTSATSYATIISTINLLARASSSIPRRSKCILWIWRIGSRI